MPDNNNWVCVPCRLSRRSPKNTYPPCSKCGEKMLRVEHVPPKADDKAWLVLGKPPKKPKATVRQAKLMKGWPKGAFEKHWD